MLTDICVAEREVVRFVLLCGRRRRCLRAHSELEGGKIAARGKDGNLGER
jgi:hypothetical protein